MSEKAKENVLRAEGKVDAAGNVKQEEKPMVDPIDKSLQVRIKAGNVQQTVKDDKNKGGDDTVFKLKLKGAIPALKEAKKDPTNKGNADAVANPTNVQKVVKQPPCEIELSL